MKRIIIVILMVMLITVGCQKLEQPNQNPAMSAKLPGANVSGEVLELSNSGSRILIDSTNEIIKGQIWVAIDDQTDFFEDLDENVAIGYKDVSRDFEAGNYVELYIGDAVMESYPMQATATAVYINNKK